MDDDTLGLVETSLDHRFRDRSTLAMALTHPSYCNEGHEDHPHNQRLEFLGDAVVNLAVAEALHERLPDADEGRLTRARARAVSREALAEAARRIELGVHLRLGRGARNQDHASGQDSVLCAAFEAVVGAIFLDAGFETARTFVLRHLDFAMSDPAIEVEAKDAKTALQEACQAACQSPPRYRVTSRAGPDHAPLFEVQVTLPDGRSWQGHGRSRKEAERDAASKALEVLGGNPRCR